MLIKFYDKLVFNASFLLKFKMICHLNTIKSYIFASNIFIIFSRKKLMNFNLLLFKSVENRIYFNAVVLMNGKEYKNYSFPLLLRNVYYAIRL